MKIIIKILMYMLFLMWSSVTAADEPSSDKKENKPESSESKESDGTETMVVTASKTEQLVEKSPVPVTVITKAEVENLPA